MTILFKVVLFIFSIVTTVFSRFNSAHATVVIARLDTHLLLDFLDGMVLPGCVFIPGLNGLVSRLFTDIIILLGGVIVKLTDQAPAEAAVKEVEDALEGADDGVVVLVDPLPAASGAEAVPHPGQALAEGEAAAGGVAVEDELVDLAVEEPERNDEWNSLGRKENCVGASNLQALYYSQKR